MSSWQPNFPGICGQLIKPHPFSQSLPGRDSRESEKPFESEFNIIVAGIDLLFIAQTFHFHRMHQLLRAS